MSYIITLPFPPSVNAYYRRGQHVTYLSKEGRAFKSTVADLVTELALPPVKGRLSVFMALSAPTKRKYDLDNRIKAVCDALQDAGAFEDDEQIDSLTVVRHPAGGGWCSVVIVEEEPCSDGLIGCSGNLETGRAGAGKGKRRGQSRPSVVPA